MQETKSIGKVTGVNGNLVIVESDAPIAQNEICYINIGDENLLGEVIKVVEKDIFVQCFESTRGLKIGNKVAFVGEMLEAKLGPGMLSKTYDGLQNDLNKLNTLFLERGQYNDALDADSKWKFTPTAKVGDVVKSGDWLGEVIENALTHKIMVPFKAEGIYTVKDIVAKGEYGLEDPLVTVGNTEEELKVTMVQSWPIKRAIKAYSEKIRPFTMLETGVRIIDSLNPIMEGGTGFIPGAFGTGKTVLQHAISKQAAADSYFCSLR